MNRCPSCRNLVPAGWIACRRCGAALTTTPPNGSGKGGTVTMMRAATPLAPVRDTMIPGSEAEPAPAARSTGDSLIPAVRPEPPPPTGVERVTARVDRRIVAVVAVVVALAVGAAAWSVLHSSSPAPDDTAAAKTLLRRTAGSARTLYDAHKSYKGVTVAAVSTRARDTPLVDAKKAAAPGQVSVGFSSTTELMLATPAAKSTCVFARDDAAFAETHFAVTNTSNCAASAAPRDGWSLT